jgi:hypothetical protein
MTRPTVPEAGPQPVEGSRPCEWHAWCARPAPHTGMHYHDGLWLAPPSSPRAGEAPEDDGCAFMGTFMGVDQRCDEPPFSHWHDPSHAAFKHAYEHDCGDCPPVRAGEAEGGVRPSLDLLTRALAYADRADDDPSRWYSGEVTYMDYEDHARAVLAGLAALASPAHPDEEPRP